MDQKIFLAGLTGRLGPLYAVEQLPVVLGLVLLELAHLLQHGHVPLALLLLGQRLGQEVNTAVTRL